MARNNNDNEDFKSRNRKRQLEEEREEQNPDKPTGKGNAETSPGSQDSGERYLQLIQSTDVSIDQVNNLFQMYIAGVERLPPIEKQKLLDQSMIRLESMEKATPAARFRYQALQSRYQTYKNRWEKLLKDLEAGKIKRIAKV